MARCCTNCGEELLGAVNRCWKCGEEVLTRGGVAMPGEEQAVAGEVVEASVVEAVDEVTTGSELVPVEAEDTGISAAESELPELQPQVPVAAESSSIVGVQMLDAPRPAAGQAAAITRYPHHLAAGGGAISSVLLAVIGLASFYWIPEGGIVIALLGIAMGAWGLYSHFRLWAVCGVALCVVAFAVSGVFLTIKVHKQMFGYGPFDAPPAEVDGAGAPLDNPAPVFKQ